MLTSNKTQILKRLFTVREAARYIGRTENAVREMVWSGKLPSVRADRRVMIDIQDLERWIESNRVNLDQIR